MLNIYQSSPTCFHYAEQAKHPRFALAYMKTYISPKYGSEWRQQIDPYLQLKICKNMINKSPKHGNKSEKIINNLTL